VIAETAKVSQSDRVAARTVEGRAVVVAIDAQRVNSLNAVGSLIWNLADGRSLGEIAFRVSDEFEIDRVTALADARRFVEELVGLELLVVEGEAP